MNVPFFSSMSYSIGFTALSRVLRRLIIDDGCYCVYISIKTEFIYGLQHHYTAYNCARVVMTPSSYR